MRKDAILQALSGLSIPKGNQFVFRLLLRVFHPLYVNKFVYTCALESSHSDDT